MINQSTLAYYKDRFLTKQINYLCNQIHEAETSTICGTHVKDEKCIKLLGRNGQAIVKETLKKPSHFAVRMSRVVAGIKE
jgi:hypothetical protein